MGFSFSVRTSTRAACSSDLVASKTRCLDLHNRSRWGYRPAIRAPFDIRPVDPAELAAVADLCEAAYAPFVAGDGGYVAALRDVTRRAAEAEVLVAVAAGGGELLGTVTFVPDGGALSEIAQPGEAEFRMLAVDPSAQGRGVGTALLRHVLEESRRRGRHGVVCSSQPGMRAAHRIYERLGFRRVPERDWSPALGVELHAFAISL